MRRSVLYLASLLVGVLLVTGCGSSSAGSTHSSTATSSGAKLSAQTRMVSISGYAYHPAQLNVPPGTRITFTNHDATAHTATATSPPFDTGTLRPGQSHTVMLTVPGTYAYICQFHPFMHGQIVVK